MEAPHREDGGMRRAGWALLLALEAALAAAALAALAWAD